jgi:succinate dehydrogenase/fumarate reductase flavoprotein subunit
MLDFTEIPDRIWNGFKSDGPAGLVRNWGGSEEMWRSILKDRSARTAPIAQTFAGGAKVKPTMQTRVARLFACGEVVNFHFDLSSVPRSEIGPLPCALTSGGIAGKYAGREAARVRDSIAPRSAGRDEVKRLQSTIGRKPTQAALPLGQRIRKIMSRHCGALRTDASLREGLEKLHRLAPRIAGLKAADYRSLSQMVEVQNMALIGHAVLNAALRRQESRSEHFREDFPEKNDVRWRRTIVITHDDQGLRLREAAASQG